MAQHDYVIANQSGAAFRADLNNALAAIVSQNSGAAEPSTTYAYMPWADTTNGLFKIRNAANSDWITLYQLDGEWSTIALEDGTAAAPSLYFKDSGTDTGVYSPGVDQVGITTAGVQRVNFNGSTEVVFNDGGADVDFRIEGDTKANLFKVDAGTDAVSIDGNLSVTGELSGSVKQGTSVASTSGTSIDFTSIPSWVKRISVQFDQVSTSGSGSIIVQLGDSGGVETTSYVGTGSFIATVGGSTITAALAATNGFVIYAGGATQSRSGLMMIELQASNRWISSHSMASIDVSTAITLSGGGSKTLSGTLDRVRITTTAGTDTFDAGNINILYEG
jgi:hypothetical protein